VKAKHLGSVMADSEAEAGVASWLTLGGRPNGPSISSAAAVNDQGPHGRQQADDWAYLWNGAGEGRGGAGSGRGSQWNGLSGVPQGWLLLILDLLSLSHPTIPFLPRRTLCRFRRGNTLYCGFGTHYYWAHPLTLCASSMPVYRRVYSTCVSGAPILNLLVDNQEIAQSFLTYYPHLPHRAMHALWVSYV